MGVEKVSVFGENFRQIVEKLEVAVEKILCSVENRGLVVDFVEKLWEKLEMGVEKCRFLVENLKISTGGAMMTESR